jgi:hypothetical protein
MDLTRYFRGLVGRADSSHLSCSPPFVSQVWGEYAQEGLDIARSSMSDPRSRCLDGCETTKAGEVALEGGLHA